MRRNRKGNINNIKTNKYKGNKMLFVFSLSVFLCVFCLTIGFSALNQVIGVEMSANVRIDADIRVTGINSAVAGGSTILLSQDYNHNNLNGAIVLQDNDQENEYAYYKIAVTNLGNERMGIAKITLSNSNLDYEIYDLTQGTDQVIGNALCDSNGDCTSGTVSLLEINLYGVSVPGGGAQSFVMEFDFQPFQTVSYESGVCSTGCVTEILKTYTYEATLTVSDASYLTVTMGGVTLTQGTDYTYNSSTKRISIPNVKGDIYISAEEPIYFANGTEVYFDVENGIKCSSTDYKTANSTTGYNGIDPATNQTSCLKFYAFNDTESATKVSLLLDHNITFSESIGYNLPWNESGSASSGPDDCGSPLCALGSLYNATVDWQGTETLSNYSYEGNNKYTIYYSDDDYTARFITADEIAQIVGESSFSETTATTGFNLSGSTGWLNDRTSADCTDRDVACYNNNEFADSDTNYYTYYWTASAANGSGSSYVWVVDDYGLWDYAADDHEIGIGVRPVIEVLKTKLD